MGQIDAIRAMEVVEGYVPSAVALASGTRALLQQVAAHAGRTLQRRQMAAFGVGGHQGHGGEKWAPLSPNTIAMKARAGFPFPAMPLVRTGNMAQGQRVRVELFLSAHGSIGFRIVAYNEAPYSRHHQRDGGSFNVWTGRNNPQRKVVDITMADLQYVRKVIAEKIYGHKAANAGLTAKKGSRGGMLEPKGIRGLLSRLAKSIRGN